MAFARFRFPHFVYFSRLKNACTLVPTVFRWHGKMAFKCHLHFSFSHDIEKQIWILLFVFRFRLTLKNGFEFQFSFFVFASLWKTDLNFVFRFCITCYWKTDWSFVCHFFMNLKSGLIHQSFETPPPPLPKGMTGIMRGLSLHNHSIFIPR